ncbi:MAG: hypothetical protein M1546_13880 [Chloroflexi bacterium]|nr:hypothetical protein [Chloroflexota bacterium]
MKRVNFRTQLKCQRQSILVVAILLMTSACGTLQVGVEGSASPAPAQSTAIALSTDNARLAAEATALAQPGTTETPVPATPPPTTNNPWSPPQTWERTSAPEAGITFDAPAGWQRLGVEWAWMAGQLEQGGPRLGLNWNDIAPGWEETAMLPIHAVMIAAATEPVDQGWGQSRTYTLKVTGPAPVGGSAAVQSVETHMIVRAGTRAYDLYASARSHSELTALMPALQHMVASVQLTTNGPATSAPGSQPSLGRLAYVRNGDIWIMDADHIEPRRLTTDGHHTEPQWSPSGQAIAFRKDGAVWVQRMDTGQTVRVDEDEEAGAVMAAWAPLGSAALFCKTGRTMDRYGRWRYGGILADHGCTAPDPSAGYAEQERSGYVALVY